MLFYLLDPAEGKSVDTTFPATTTLDVLGFPDKVASAFKEALNPTKYQQFFIALEASAVKTAKGISNGIVANQRMIGGIVFDLYKDTIKYGASISDSVDFITEFGEKLGKLPNIQKEVIQNGIILSKVTGLTVKEVAGFVAGMGDIGIGQQRAMEKLNKIYVVGRKYGVDASKLTKDVATNISKASIYGFKDGVDGLTKMAARAQQLGIKMEQAMKFAQDVLDPDTAIETAASFQMLGGAVGALGDPFQLLYMAQNDVGALQEEMVKATESAVDFNATTGEFKIPVSEMYRLKEMAGKLGMSYEDISENAIKAAKQTQVLSMIELPSNFSEEDKNLVASLSEIQSDGSVKIQIPGQEGLMDASLVGAAELEKLRQVKELEGKSEKDLQSEMNVIAKQQLSAQDKANISLDEIKNSLIFARGQGGLDVIPKQLTNMSESGSDFADLIKSSSKTSEALTLLEKVVTDATSAFKNYIDNNVETDMNNSIQSFINLLNNTFPTTNPMGSTSGAGTVTPTIDGKDLFIGKTGTNKIVNGGFGEFYSLDKRDELLAMPNITDMINDTNAAFEKIISVENVVNANMPENFTNFVKNISKKEPTEKKSTSIQDLIGNNLDRLNEVKSTIINQNITSSQKVEGNVGVDGNVNINVNVPNGLLSTALSSDREFQGALKDEIMKVVNYRLSEAYKKGQGNLS